MSTPQEILEQAEGEGVEVGVRYGRLTYRGASPALRTLLQANEREIVEHLGEQYTGALHALTPDPAPRRHFSGR